MEKLNYLEILSNGLPKSKDLPKHIVIVGAGISGLMAGYLLKKAGHTVTILEAQNRLGGRILTYRGFAGEMYGEFGAMRFPRQHELATYLIHEMFQLETKPFPMYDEDTFIYMQGRAVRRSEFTPDTFNYQIAEHERGKTPQEILRAVVQPLIDIMDGEDKDAAWDKLVTEYDHYSLIQYFTERGLSDGALSMLGPLLNLEGRYHFSLVEWFAHYYEDVFGDLDYVVNGAETIARSFEPHLMDDIRLGAKVQAVQQTYEKVIVHYNAGGQMQKVIADECIITIPFTLLRHMEIEGLDADKWYAIRNAYYGRAHKIFMQFSERWWETKYNITHGLTVTDLAIRNVVYTPAGQDPRFQKGVLIASYGWEQDSIAYSPLPEADRIAQALEDLIKIHPEARHTFEFGISHDWALDQYAGGIGPLFRPMEMGGKIYDDLIRPVHRVWFANDGCDRRHRRWIEASLKAAIKNCYGIHKGMRNQMPYKD